MSTIGPLLIAVLAHAALAGFFGAFTLDDSYITYRYAENWVHLGALVWNPGEDPVEGFTSFLWTALLAGAAGLRLPVEATSKALGIAASVATLVLLHREMRRAELDAPTRTALLGAIGLSPAFAILATQGMETALAGLVLLGVALALDRGIVGSRRATWAFFGLGTLALLVRPDAFPFLVATALTALVGLVRRGERATVYAALYPAAFFAAAGGAYFVGRATYFGHWLPNPFYIKGGGLFSTSGALYVARFVLLVMAPLAAFTLLGPGRPGEGRSAGLARPGLAARALLVGAVVFVGYFVTVRPIQGAMYRYLYPIVPVLVRVVVAFLRGRTPQPGGPRAWVAASVLALLSLHTLPEALENRALRSSGDRIAMARALARFEGRTLFTTEAGALPYLSGWRSYDVLGLNSEEIAHEGLTEDFLARIDPDVIMMLNFDERVATDHPGYRTTARFIEARGYVEVARIRKNARATHSYFLRASEALSSDLRDVVVGLPGVEYVRLSD